MQPVQPMKPMKPMKPMILKGFLSAQTHFKFVKFFPKNLTQLSRSYLDDKCV